MPVKCRKIPRGSSKLQWPMFGLANGIYWYHPSLPHVGYHQRVIYLACHKSIVCSYAVVCSRVSVGWFLHQRWAYFNFLAKKQTLAPNDKGPFSSDAVSCTYVALSCFKELRVLLMALVFVKSLFFEWYYTKNLCIYLCDIVPFEIVTRHKRSVRNRSVIGFRGGSLGLYRLFRNVTFYISTIISLWCWALPTELHIPVGTFVLYEVIRGMSMTPQPSPTVSRGKHPFNV